jgi:cyclopropane-fatty-acyl-phospholipid synthase
VLASLRGLKAGRLELACPNGTWTFGEPDAELHARVRVLDLRVFRMAVMEGEVGLGDARMQGLWEADDLVAVVRIAIRNMAAFDRAGGILAGLGKALNRLRHRRRRNTVEGSKENISHHYDLGNAFYSLWLDPTMAYSCAVYAREDEDLEMAQRRKFDRICEKLRLGPEDHLLEIGTGWGGFAAHAAAVYGCRVTTTTLSREQHTKAAELFKARGLDDRIELRLEDYRHLGGVYDKAVSIEMFEAVGLEHYDAYFSSVDRLLKPGGTFLLQTITMNERSFPAYIRASDWIQRRIFPGAELASVMEIQRSLARCSRLALFDLEDIGTHYARTLRAWRRRFLAVLDQVQAQGFDGTFIRMWEYYLASCEGGFLERHISDAQLLLVKEGATGPLLREPW